MRYEDTQPDENSSSSRPELAEKTRVIHQSPPFGIPPVVTDPTAQPHLVAEMQSALLNMRDTSAGSAALQAASIDGYVLIEDAKLPIN